MNGTSHYKRVVHTREYYLHLQRWKASLNGCEVYSCLRQLQGAPVAVLYPHTGEKGRLRRTERTRVRTTPISLPDLLAGSERSPCFEITLFNNPIAVTRYAKEPRFLYVVEGNASRVRVRTFLRPTH